MQNERECRRLRACKVVVLFASGLAALSGCTEGTPKASISDPQVFTMQDIADAQKELEAAGILEALRRNFLTPDGHQDLLKADAMLLGSQRSSLLVTQIMRLASLRLLYRTPVSSGAPTAPQQQASDGTDDATHKKLAELIASSPQSSPGDSPFDRLNRVNDFYTAILLKYLQAVGPKHQQLNISTGTRNSVDPIAFAAPSQEQKQLLLSVQTHLDPGTKPSYYAGVLVSVVAVLDKDGVPIVHAPFVHEIGTDGEHTAKRLSRASVHILHVHPTHTYDLDETNYVRSLRNAIRLTGEITGPDVTGGADISHDTADDLGREFYSRIAKQASFVNANEKIFGWNFYPSNLQLRKRGLLHSFLASLIGDSESYDIDSSLEGGARDCAVFISVPANASYLTLRVGYSYAGIGGNQVYQPGIIGDIITGKVRTAEKIESRDPQEIVVLLPESGAGMSVPTPPPAQ